MKTSFVTVPSYSKCANLCSLFGFQSYLKEVLALKRLRTVRLQKAKNDHRKRRLRLKLPVVLQEAVGDFKEWLEGKKGLLFQDKSFWRKITAADLKRQTRNSDWFWEEVLDGWEEERWRVSPCRSVTGRGLIHQSTAKTESTPERLRRDRTDGKHYETEY